MDITVAIGINPVKSSHRTSTGQQQERCGLCFLGPLVLLSSAFGLPRCCSSWFSTVTGIAKKKKKKSGCLLVYFYFVNCLSDDFCTVALCFHFSCPTEFYVYHILHYPSG